MLKASSLKLGVALGKVRRPNYLVEYLTKITWLNPSVCSNLWLIRSEPMERVGQTAYRQWELNGLAGASGLSG